MSESANRILPPFLATPSIELKKRIGARKKTKKKRQKKETHFKTKKRERHISKTARIPIGKFSHTA